MRNRGLTREEIARIETRTEEEYGIGRLILMENAGRCIAETIRDRCAGTDRKRICVFSGKGNNGGDGFVASRYLFNMGADVRVFHFGSPEAFTKISFTNYGILCKMKIDCFPLDGRNIADFDLRKTDVIVDALLGTGMRGTVAGSVAELISVINKSGKFTVCADIPSGLNANTGRICGTAVKGNITVSFGFAKRGFYLNDGPEYCGEIVIADIGFPRFLKKRR